MRKRLPWIVTPSSFMHVKSDWARSPGSYSWAKNTSFAGPSVALHEVPSGWGGNAQDFAPPVAGNF